MTTLDWNAPTDPDEMLVLLNTIASGRKLRLLCCACAWRVAHRLDNSAESLQAIRFAEDYADGLRAETERVLMLEAANAAIDRVDDFQETNACRAAAWCVEDRMDSLSVTRSALWSAANATGEMEEQERTAQIAIVRDICDNYFLKKSLSKSHVTSSVVTLARQMYESRQYNLMRELAEALELSSCTDHDILGHCRNSTQHVMGCWVVDLVLGKK